MAWLDYLIYFGICQFGVLLCVLVVISIGTDLRQILAGGPLQKVVNLATYGRVVFLSVGGSWISHNFTRRTVRDNEHPLAAIHGAVTDARMYLSFLPWIGRLFRYRERTRPPYDGPDDLERP